jgi:hypothetical protein
LVSTAVATAAMTPLSGLPVIVRIPFCLAFLPANLPGDP